MTTTQTSRNGTAGSIGRYRRRRSARFVRALAERIARFPPAGVLAIKDRVNAITLAPTEDFRRDSDLFGEEVHNAETQRRIQAAMRHGLQTRRAELEFANILNDLAG